MSKDNPRYTWKLIYSDEQVEYCLVSNKAQFEARRKGWDYTSWFPVGLDLSLPPNFDGDVFAVMMRPAGVKEACNLPVNP